MAKDRPSSAMGDRQKLEAAARELKRS
jgi:hypothetical protein